MIYNIPNLTNKLYIIHGNYDIIHGNYTLYMGIMTLFFYMNLISISYFTSVLLNKGVL